MMSPTRNLLAFSSDEYCDCMGNVLGNLLHEDHIMDTAEHPVFEKGVIPSEKALVAQWLGQFDVALQGANQASLASLFASDGHWRDLLAFTWSITPSQGAETIAALMVARQPDTRARGFAIAEGRTPPRRVQRAGIDVIEAIFQFETEVGRGFGVLRLLASEPAKALQMMTSLHELKGFEETIGTRCPTGEAFFQWLAQEVNQDHHHQAEVQNPPEKVFQ